MTVATVSKPRKIGLSKGDRVFTIVNFVFLALIFVVTLYPMLYVLSASFSDPNAVSSGKMVLLPVKPSLQAYQYILQYQDIWTGYGNTIFYTIVGTLINLAVTLPCAYALSRRDFKPRNVLMILFVITMYFQGGLIPSYLNMRSLHLVNTRWALLILGAVSVYNLIVARTFFTNSIPWEMHEAAFLDGCSDFRLFLRIVLPLSMPITVVMTLYYGIAHWNAYFNAYIYIRDRSLYPLQVFLREILTLGSFMSEIADTGAYTAADVAYFTKQAETANMMKYAIIVVSTLPMLVLYPLLQKYFTKGVMIGSVKD